MKTREAKKEAARDHKKKTKRSMNSLANKLGIITIALVIGALALVMGVRVSVIKKELARRQKHNLEVLQELEQEQQRAQELQERRKYEATDKYAIEVAREKLGMVFPDEIAIKSEN